MTLVELAFVPGLEDVDVAVGRDGAVASGKVRVGGYTLRIEDGRINAVSINSRWCDLAEIRELIRLREREAAELRALALELERDSGGIVEHDDPTI